jgi:hypothetical protein
VGSAKVDANSKPFVTPVKLSTGITNREDRSQSSFSDHIDKLVKPIETIDISDDRGFEKPTPMEPQTSASKIVNVNRWTSLPLESPARLVIIFFAFIAL